MLPHLWHGGVSTSVFFCCVFIVFAWLCMVHIVFITLVVGLGMFAYIHVQVCACVYWCVRGLMCAQVQVQE